MGFNSAINTRKLLTMTKQINNGRNSGTTSFLSFQQYKKALKNLILCKLKFVICLNENNYKFIK